jgi:predicted enzyme related to lactoylglutathione lyase/quinol monooxygenase YgiN
MAAGRQVSLISRWFVKPGCGDAALKALTHAANEVRDHEPGTLTYRVHVEHKGDGLQSLPPVDPLSILFFEVYRDADAFRDHLNGPVFTGFVRDHGHLFVQAGGKPYTTVDFLSLHAGFTRREDAAAAGDAGGAGEAAGANRHPAVMFEIIAKNQKRLTRFYSQVFGWRYETGTGGFAYVHFPAGAPPLLGGIGQAEPNTPGFAPGHNFYLLVDALEPMLDRAIEAGAAPLMPPTPVDGYRFAMFTDPEGNPIGLIEPFCSQAGTHARSVST